MRLLIMHRIKKKERKKTKPSEKESDLKNVMQHDPHVSEELQLLS